MSDNEENDTNKDAETDDSLDLISFRRDIQDLIDDTKAGTMVLLSIDRADLMSDLAEWHLNRSPIGKLSEKRLKLFADAYSKYTIDESGVNTTKILNGLILSVVAEDLNSFIKDGLPIDFWLDVDRAGSRGDLEGYSDSCGKNWVDSYDSNAERNKEYFDSQGIVFPEAITPEKAFTACRDFKLKLYDKIDSSHLQDLLLKKARKYETDSGILEALEDYIKNHPIISKN
jgi:hypothetical protein